eukprot:1775121-Amphidinium_carterae.2
MVLDFIPTGSDDIASAADSAAGAVWSANLTLNVDELACAADAVALACSTNGHTNELGLTLEAAPQKGTTVH